MKFVPRLLMVAALAGMTVAAVALAVPQGYAQKIQNIRAGVVILDSSGLHGYGESAAPFALYNLDNATNIKPAGWNIYNPHAPGVATQQMVTKWIANEVGNPNDLPAVGAPISKSKAEYWAVYLDNLSEQALSDYDVLLVNPVGLASLNPTEQAKLMKFMDQGGILWVDPAGSAVGGAGNSDQLNNYPLAFLPISTAGSGGAFADVFNPLLTTPNTITSNDLNILHSDYAYGVQADFLPAGDASLAGFFNPLFAEFSKFKAVTAVSINPTTSYSTITSARVGDGAMVVTATGVSIILNRVSGVNLGLNASYTADSPVLEQDGQAAAKLAVNIISLSADAAQAGRGARKTSSISIDAGAPTLKRWTAEGVPSATPSVIYKGVVVSASVDSATTGHLTVFASQPGSNLDGLGAGDNGIGSLSFSDGIDDTLRDLTVGQPADIIWRSPAMPGPISAPTCVEIPNGNGPVDEVLVVDHAGTLHIFNLFPKNNFGYIIGGQNTEIKAIPVPSGIGAYDAAFNNGVPNPATVSDELAYMTAPVAPGISSVNDVGAIWVVDLTSNSYMTSAGDWYVGGTQVIGQAGLMPACTGPATVGYIPMRGQTGGYDKVLYFPGVSGNQPGFASLWIGAKGESPLQLGIQTGTLSITTRAGGFQNLALYDGGAGTLGPLDFKVTLTDTNGNAEPAAVYKTVFSGSPTYAGGGIINIGLNNVTMDIATFNASYGIRVDYTIDWGNSPQTDSNVILRGSQPVLFPIPQAPVKLVEHRILGNIALTAQGTMCMVVGDPAATPGSGGSLWWIREDQGIGGFRVVSRFSLFPKHEVPLVEAVPTPYPQVFSDADPLTGLSAYLQGDMSGFVFAGGASVQGNQVFATAMAYKTQAGVNVPTGILMAFQADPQTPTLHIPGLPNGTSFVQPDFDRSDESPGFSDAYQSPDVSSSISTGYTYDSNTGVITFPNLAGGFQQGQLNDCLSLSQPVIVRSPGVPDQLLEPDELADIWTPLLWYTTMQGAQLQGPNALVSNTGPVVTGDSVFVASSSVVPSLLTTGTLTTSGMVSAIDAVIPANDKYMVQPGVRSWQNQVAVLLADGSGAPPNNLDPDYHIRMPQATGVKSFADYQTRLLQTVLGSSTAAFGLAAGEDSVVAMGNNGVYGFGRAVFAVCDQGRVLEVDSSGNPIYAINGTLNVGPGGGSLVGNVHSLVRPTRAYMLTPTSLLVVDTGGNRIVQMDGSGVETRSLKKILPDPGIKPDGYTANEPLTFNAPRDVATYAGYSYPPAKPVVTGQTGVEYWVHYLVADSGNHRLVELIDRYNVNQKTLQVGGPVELSMPNPSSPPVNGVIPTANVAQVGVLLWQTPSTVSGKDFNYNSISRVYLGTNTNQTGRYVYVAGIGTTQPTRIDTGLDNPASAGIRQTSVGDGGVVVFDPLNPNGAQVYNSFDMPNLQNTPFYDSQSGAFDLVPSQYFIAQTGRQLAGVNSVTARATLDSSGNGVLAIMVAESTGVYEFLVNPAAAGASADLGTPNWMINGPAYTAFRSNPPGGNAIGTNASQFNPTYARRLDTGEVLLVNGYTGTTRGGSAYTGEVVLMQGANDNPLASNNLNGEFGFTKRNLGFSVVSLHFALPPILGVRTVVSPVFADRR